MASRSRGSRRSNVPKVLLLKWRNASGRSSASRMFGTKERRRQALMRIQNRQKRWPAGLRRPPSVIALPNGPAPYFDLPDKFEDRPCHTDRKRGGWTLPDLQVLAEAAGVPNFRRYKKADLCRVLAGKAAEEPAVPAPKAVKRVKPPVAVEAPSRSRKSEENLEFSDFMDCEARRPRDGSTSKAFPGGFKLSSHQVDVVSRILDDRTKGLILYFGMGSGKTLSSLASAEALFQCRPDLVKGAVVVAPASLVPNYQKEIVKYKAARKKYTVMSYVKASKVAANIADGKILIVDESHNVRNPKSAGFKAVSKLAKQAAKVLLLTGTPVANHPYEIAPLIDIVYPGSMPLDQLEFEQYFGKSGLSRRREYMRSMVRKVLMFYNPPGYSSGAETPDFPALEYRDIFVPMTDRQRSEHKKYARGNARRLKDVEKKSSFYLKQRQLCNDVEGDRPKLELIVANCVKYANRGEKSVVYSFFAAKGISLIAGMLLRRCVRFATFSGKQNEAEKKRAVAAFNEDKIMILLISDAGAEGLDLKHARHVHICDPTWNESLTAQVVGRARRFRSHTSEDVKRLVEVHRYYCTYGKEENMDPRSYTSKNASADMLIRALAAKKDSRCKAFLKAIVSWIR